MKKILFATFLLSANAAMAQSNFFAGADIGYTMAKSDSIEMEYSYNGEESTNYLKIDDSDINFSVNFGYKFDIENTKFFIMPKISYDFKKLKFDDEKGYEKEDRTGFPIVVEEDYNSNLDAEINPTYGVEVNFGYKINDKNSIYFGTGIKNIDYDIYVYNTYKKETENEATDTETVNADIVFDKETINDNKIAVPFTIGYMYNLENNIIIDANYTYTKFDIEDIDVDMSTLKIGAKYLF